MAAPSEKVSAARRRDVRNQRNADAPRAAPGTKNTRRWCLGKVGRDHELHALPSHDYPKYGPRGLLPEHWFLVCAKCGKRLKTWDAAREARPAWLDDVRAVER
jgi:hypothetical protein